MVALQNPDHSFFRKCLTEYLCFLPPGSWPEFTAQTRSARRQVLARRDMADLLKLFIRTNKWYLKYAFQYLTAPLRKQPTFFLMGFPKCGTTFLANMLNTLHQVDGPTSLAPGGKETVHYRRDQKLHWFMPIRGFYPIFSQATHFMDASVSYSLDPGALALASKDYPDARVIIVVRDQVSAIQSAINYYNFGLWRPDPKSLQIFNDAEAYRQFPMEKAYAMIDYCRQFHCSIVVAFHDEAIIELLGNDAAIAHRFAPILYDLWMQSLYQNFDPENVYVINFSELIKEPESILIQAADFIGIQADAIQLDLHEDKLKKNTSRKVFRLNEKSRQVISEKFFAHNEALKALTGIDLNP
jgi:hypothetical protein